MFHANFDVANETPQFYFQEADQQFHSPLLMTGDIGVQPPLENQLQLNALVPVMNGNGA